LRAEKWLKELARPQSRMVNAIASIGTFRTQCGCKGIHDEFDSGRDRSRMERSVSSRRANSSVRGKLNVW